MAVCFLWVFLFYRLVPSRARETKKKKPQERKTASHQERKSNWLAVFLSCGFFFLVSVVRARKEKAADPKSRLISTSSKKCPVTINQQMYLYWTHSFLWYQLFGQQVPIGTKKECPVKIYLLINRLVRKLVMCFLS